MHSSTHPALSPIPTVCSWITNFLSAAVISGFMTGACVIIALSQVGAQQAQQGAQHAQQGVAGAA